MASPSAPKQDNCKAPHNGTDECCHNLKSRNLIVCIDGTRNQPGEKATNVSELKAMLKTDNQKFCYWKGIGTNVRPRRPVTTFVENSIDSAIAWNLEKNILSAYGWLSNNYEPGDCIFLFGFSRGAYQIRVLSAMIDIVGLMHIASEKQSQFAYKVYEKHRDVKSGTPTAAERFKEMFSYKDIKVHFVGAWDTVSSVGFGRNLLPRTVDGMKHVCYFRHALALDEQRVKFLPEYACRYEDQEGSNVSTLKDNGTIQDKKRWRPQTLEVWFPGTHSDIGGGNVENPGADRGRPSLRWMVFEAGAVGLRTKPFERELIPLELLNFNESFTTMWRLAEDIAIKPLNSLMNHAHPGSSRIIYPGQRLHGSLQDGIWKNDYEPRARLLKHDPDFWKSFKGGINQWPEYDDPRIVLDEFIVGIPDRAVQALHVFASSRCGWQTVYEALIDALSRLDTEDKHRLLRFSLPVLCIRSQHDLKLKLCSSNKTLPFVSDLLESNNKDHQKTALDFMLQLTDYSINVLHGHKDWISSVSFSPDGKRVVSGSHDNTVRIWDLEDPVGNVKCEGHGEAVRSVLFSPNGKHVVSGSDDKTIRIWDMSGKQFQGNEDSFGSLVAGEVLIWDARNGRREFGSVSGHVESVALSRDHKYVVSSWDDNTIRLWDVEIGRQVGVGFQGHTGVVRSVAFSFDSQYVVSGSNDGTVRIWDVRKGEQVGEALSKGRKRAVRSVSFSPDGKYVVSGSEDGSVEILDVMKGEGLLGPLRGHGDTVSCVVFSPDGRRVVSGSDDKAIRIWDVETILETMRRVRG